MASWLDEKDVAAAKADEWLNQAKTKTQAWLTSFTGAASPMPDQQTAVPEPAPAMPQIKLPTAEELRALAPWRDLDPQPSPAQTPATLVDGRQQVQPGLRPGEQMGSVSITQGADDGIADVSPDEPVSSETVTRAAAAALKKAGLSPEMAPYIAGIAINEGILQPGTIARDNWSVGGVKADGTAGSVTVPTREVIDGQSVMQTASFGAFNTMQEGMDALAAFVRDSPRFGPVVRQAMQTGDYSNLIAGFKEGGYATDPNWVQQVTSIASGLTAPVQGPRPTTPPVAEQTPQAMAQGQYAAGSWTPNQINAATAEGLDYETALAVCGPAAAIAFARKNGRNPSMAEAVALAREVGWTPDAGMAGPASQQRLLERMGVAARLEDGAPNWQAVAADVQRGNPVTISTPGHYFVAERYDPESGAFDFGQSAAVLKASGGRTWFRPEELANLGMGEARATLFIDNPNSPSPSVAAGRMSLNTAPTVSPAVVADTPAGAGAASPPAPASTPPAAPWANETGTGGLMMKADGTEDFLPGDGGYAPQTYEQPYDPDQGPREAPAGSVGSQPLPQTPNPMTYGPIDTSGPAEGPPTLGEITYQSGGEPTGNGPWTEMPVRPLEAQQPAPDEQASASPSMTDHLGNVLLPVLDAAGNVVSYVQQQARNLGRQIAPRGNPVANVAQGLTPGGQTYGQAVAPIMNPRRETNVAPEAFVRDALDIGTNAPKIPGAVDQKITDIANEARQQFQQAGQAYGEGDMTSALYNGVLGALNVVASPWTVAAEGIDTALPTMRDNSVLSMGDAITNADMIRDARHIANGVAKLIAAGRRVTPEIVAALRNGTAVEDILNSAASAIDRGIERAAPIVQRAGEVAQGVGREVAGGLMDLTPAARVMQESGGGMREIKPTVEVLQDQLDWMRSVIERARASGDAALEKRAIDRAWQLESELVDARNARLDLEPRITSDVGRRIEDLPLTEESASDFAGIGRERVSPSAAADLTPPSAVATDMSGRMNSALPGFDPASAAMGGAAGAMSEGEDGEAGDPLRTAAGIGLGAFGARVTRKPGHTVATGLKPGQRYEFRVRVVPLRDLITSHLDNLTVNRAFPGALQPRIRDRAASRVQIDKMVQAFDPEQVLMDTHRVDSGPMIVGPDMVVESGNGRGIALRRLAQENPEAYANYVQALREELPYYGLTEDALKGIDQPVLVRERITPLDDAERARFASEANAPTAAQMSSMEQALADARNIGDGPLGRIAVGEDQTIDEALLAPENGAFVRAFMATVPDTERGKMLEANGNLSVTGLARVKAALLARTYPGAAGERVATAIVESTDAGLRNVQNAVMGSLPSMARVEGLVAAGDVDAGLSLADDIAAAVDVYARLKRAGILVGDYLQQAGMFGGRETTPLQDAILGYLNENARAPRRLRALLEGYAREVETTAGAAGDMFGGPATAATKEELLDGVLRRLGAAPGADQGADLGRTGAGSNVVEGAGARQLAVPPADTGAQAGRNAGSPSLIDEVNAAETLTPEEQIARLQAENDRLRAERRGGGRRQQAQQPAPLQNADLPPVADDLIPTTGGEAGALQVEGAPRPMQRPGPIGDILPATGGEAGTLAQEGAPVPFARPGALPSDVVPATSGPEGRLRVQEDRQAVEQLMADSSGARRYDDQQRRQISDATARYAEDVRELSRQIAEERAAGNTPDRLMAERAAAAHRLHATMLLAEGRRGAAARAFREYDRLSGLLKRNPKRAVEQMHKRFGGQENAAAAADEYTRMVEDGATPVQLAKFWAGIERGKITGADLFALFRRFNMLSGPRTIEVNALSGALNLGYEVLSQAGGQLARGRGAEAAAEMAAPFKAMGRAFGNLAETMRHGVSAEQAARGDIPRTLSSRTDNRAAKGVLTAMEMPDRFNAAVDQFYRTMTEDWAATMLAHKRARADGLNPRSEKWADAVAKHLQDIRDDPDVLPEIKAMADHVTFSEEPGGIGRGLEEFRRRAPLVANVLFPFIRTPYNIASRAVDLSPLGVVRTGAEVLTGRGRGRENVSRRVRDNAIGLAAAYWAYDQAQQGNITGAGPDDPEKQAQLRATGWQPYSIKVGDRYWSYANFAPFSLALSLGAAAHEAKQYAKPGETDTLALLGDAATRTAKVVTDMTVLQGIGAVIKSIQDPDRYGGAWLTQFLSTLIPAGSLLNTVGQATDDTVRRSERDTFANQVSQGVQARIPGLRQGVPAAQDPLGRTVPNEQQGVGALNPFRPTTRRNDPAIQAFIDSGVDISKPKDKLTVVSGAAPIELTPAEQRRWNELRGAVLVQNVPNVAGSQRYQEAEKLARAKGLQTMLAAAAQAADKQLIAEIGGDEIKRRLTGAIEKRRAS